MASNFLWYNGSTTNSGLVTPVSTLMSSELAGVTNGQGVTSSVGGASGLFTQSTSAQAILAEVTLSLGSPGIGSAVAAGGNVALWFLTSVDGGTTIETPSSTVSPPRPPDVVIPLPATTISTAPIPTFNAPRYARVPAMPFKVYAQNNLGQTIGGSSSVAPSVKLAPVAVQY